MSFFSRQGFSGLSVGYREGAARERGGLPLGTSATHGELGPAGGQEGESPWSRMGFPPIWN